jgi:hypothetical protein
MTPERGSYFVSSLAVLVTCEYQVDCPPGRIHSNNTTVADDHTAFIMTGRIGVVGPRRRDDENPERQGDKTTASDRRIV